MYSLRIAALQYLEKDSNEILVVTHPTPPYRLPVDLLLLYRIYLNLAVLLDFRQDHRHQVTIDSAFILREYAVQGEDCDTVGEILGGDTGNFIV